MHRDSSLILTITPSKVSHKSQRFVCAQKSLLFFLSLSLPRSPRRDKTAALFLCIGKNSRRHHQRRRERDNLCESAFKTKGSTSSLYNNECLFVVVGKKRGTRDVRFFFRCRHRHREETRIVVVTFFTSLSRSLPTTLTTRTLTTRKRERKRETPSSRPQNENEKRVVVFVFSREL